MRTEARRSTHPGTRRRHEADRRLDREIERSAAEIEALRVAHQRFLAGDLRTPPIDDALRLKRQLRTLRERAHGAAAQFRLTGLEAKLQSNLELFDRRLEARESTLRERGAATGEALDPEAGVVVGRGDDRAAEQALFTHLTRDPRAAARLDAERFRSMLQRNVAMIREKTGCREVFFRVVFEDGKPKLKAKAIRIPE